jgi:hypothetical protein
MKFLTLLVAVALSIEAIPQREAGVRKTNKETLSGLSCWKNRLVIKARVCMAQGIEKVESSGAKASSRPGQDDQTIKWEA